MAEKTNLTVDDCMKGAFQALLKGDTHTRDVLCAQAMKACGSSESVSGDTVVVGDVIEGECTEIN